MKKFNKIAVGLIAGVIAIGASSYISASKVAEDDIYVQTDTDVYTRLQNPLDYESSLCVDDSEKPCAYIQVDNETYNQTLPASEISTNPSFVTMGNEEGLYDQ